MLRFALLICALLAVPALASADDWDAARADGAILLMRHATAPGTGDPAGFVLDDCETQRNLSDEGRAQARDTGTAIREAGVGITHVLTSEWCRCRDTARLLGLGPVQDWPSLNSFFADRSLSGRPTAETLAGLAGLPDRARPILVTHQVNITALTGIVPRSGEIIVTRLTPEGLTVTGRIAPR